MLIPRGNFYQYTGGQWIYRLNADRTRAVMELYPASELQPEILHRRPFRRPLRPAAATAPDRLSVQQQGDLVITTGYDTFGDVEELLLK